MKLAIFFNLPSGGGKRALFEQVKRLAKRHEVDVYTLSTANHEFCDLRKIVKNYFIYDFRYPDIFPLNIFSIYFFLPFIHQKIADRINRGNYDVAFINSDLFTQAPYILNYLKIPSVYYSQEPKREFYEKIPRISKKYTYMLTYPFRYPLKLIDRSNIAKASLVLTNSVYSQKRIKAIYNLNSSVNYLGVDTNLFKPLKNIKKENIVLSVGGFNLLKGHGFVIKSISLIPENKRPEFAIVGNGGEEEDYIRNLAQKSGVNLKIIENATDEELVKWYNKAKIFLYAPHDEPFGLATLEAVASGLPVIAVNEGGIAEILKKVKPAILIERNPLIMSTKIIQIMNEYKRYTYLNDYNDMIAKNFNWNKSVEELESYLGKLC